MPKTDRYVELVANFGMERRGGQFSISREFARGGDRIQIRQGEVKFRNKGKQHSYTADEAAEALANEPFYRQSA